MRGILPFLLALAFAWPARGEVFLFDAPSGQPTRELTIYSTLDEGLAYLREHSGSQFDPQCVAMAERWRDRVMRADAALQLVEPGDSGRVEAAASALKAVTALMQAEVAPALEVSIGFSSADGDCR